MGMSGNYIAVEEAVLNEVLQGKTDILDIDLTASNCLDIDKTWQAILFLLCDEIADGEPPLGYVVPLRGENLIGDCGMDYGAFYLTANQVAEALVAIKPYTREQLLAQFDWSSFIEHDIYPVMADEDETQFFDYVYSNFEALKQFFINVQAEKKSVIFYII